MTAPKRVVVTGVGAAPGFDLARALSQAGHTVIAADAHPLAAGLALPGVTARVLPDASAPGFTDAVLVLCRETGADALWPTVEAELPHLARIAADLERAGVRTWLPEAHAIEACGDKNRFAAVLTAARVPTPATWLPHELGALHGRGPWVVKPRFGWGSKHLAIATTRAQAQVLCEVVPDPIVQDRLTGEEFTADCLIDRSGTASVILRRRLVVKGGLAHVTQTFTDADIAAQVRAALKATGVVGLVCVQGFATGAGPVITEINARIAGSFTASRAAGADLVGEGLAGLLGLPVDHTRLAYRPGVRTTKYVETLTSREVTQ